MTGIAQLDKALTMAAEREAQAANYRKGHSSRSGRPARAVRLERERRAQRFRIAAVLGR